MPVSEGELRFGRPVGITEGLTWIRVLRYVGKWHNAVAFFLSLSEGYPLESTPSNRMLSSALPRSAWQAKPPGYTYFGYTGLVTQDHAQEATVNRQLAAARVIDKAQCAELVHEITDP